MAFNVQTWGNVPNTNQPIQTLQNATQAGSPTLWTYTSNVDTLAVVSAANYFASRAPLLSVGDFLFITASDGSEIFTVSTVTLVPASVIIGTSVGIGNVVGPAASTDTAIATWNGVTGKLLNNSVVLLSVGGALTGLTGISVTGAIQSLTGNVWQFWNPAGTFSNTIGAGANLANVAYTWPVAAPTVNGQVMSATTAGVMSWTSPIKPLFINQTTTPVTMASNVIYSANNAGLVTLNMPALAAIGDQFEVVGQGAGGWLIQMAAGQTANFNSTSTSVAGSLASTNRYNCITLICTVANTTFTVKDSSGVITEA